MGFAPQFVDMNGDGLEDILSGSYAGDAPQPEGNEGHLVPVTDANGDAASEVFVYYRLPDGSFEDRVAIGLSHTHSAASPVDWDGDGDFDLITASRSSSASPDQAGAINLYENVGTPREPALAPFQILVGRVQGHFITSAEAWDWDEDGHLDLVAGTEYGKILWFRNTGSGNEDAFDEPVTLTPEEEESSGLGSTRLAIYITDWDGDGVQDVIGGDFFYRERTEEEILEGAGPSEIEAYRVAREKVDEFRAKVDTLYDGVDFPNLSDEEREAIDQKYEEISAPYSEYQELLREKYSETSYHGYVWFFRGEKH